MYHVSRNGTPFAWFDREDQARRLAEDIAASSQPGEVVEVHMGKDLIASFAGTSHTFGECAAGAACVAVLGLVVGMIEVFV